MFYSCYAPVDYDCESCHEKVYGECTDLTIRTRYTPYTYYFIHIVDKFYNHYVQKVLSNGVGDLTITTDGLPDNFFNKYSGEIEIKISETLTGDYIDITLNGVTRQCLIVIINETAPEDFTSKSFYFDAANEYFQGNQATLDQINSLFAGTGKKFTIVMWVKKDRNGTFEYLYSTDAAVNAQKQSYIYIFTDNKIYFNIVYASVSASVWKTANAYTSLSSFYQIAISFDGTLSESIKAKIYVNAVLDTSFVGSGGGDTSTINTAGVVPKIGARLNNSVPFKGYSNAFAIYDDVLSAAEILELYNNGEPFDYRTASTSANLAYYLIPDNATWNGTKWIWSNEIDSSETFESVNMEEEDLMIISP
jgi:hypothetical protein